MARFKSTLKRAAALATVAIAALVGQQTANAQNATGSPINGFDARTNDLAHSGNRGSGGSELGSVYLDTYNKLQKEREEAANKSPTKQIVADRTYENRVYDIAVAGIDKVLRTQGPVAAEEFRKHPERNLELTGLLRKGDPGQAILTTIIVGDALYYSIPYIQNYGQANGSNKPPTLSDAIWTESVSGAMEHINNIAGKQSQLSYLQTNRNNPKLFGGPNTRIALDLVVQSQAKAPTLTASAFGQQRQTASNKPHAPPQRPAAAQSQAAAKSKIPDPCAEVNDIEDNMRIALKYQPGLNICGDTYFCVNLKNAKAQAASKGYTCD